jgi:signal transduction histidine kinase
MQPDFKPINIFDFLGNIAAQIQLTANEHHIDCELPDSPVIFSCDPVQMEMLIRLLLDNAVKYSPGGGTVVLRAIFPRSDELHIEVIDYGSGMTHEQIDHAFEPYYRAHAIPGIGGLGLGLNLVKHIAELHGGTVSCSSVPLQGSTFTVCLKQPLA